MFYLGRKFVPGLRALKPKNLKKLFLNVGFSIPAAYGLTICRSLA